MNDTVRVAAVGDVHCTKTSQGALQPLFAQMVESADVLVLCGDLADYGLADEARILAHELGVAIKAKVPVIGVLGNHDHESGEADTVKQILCDAGVTILDGDAIEVHGIGFAGTKGFCGGFGRRALEPWGEGAIKAFVRESLDESLKLESALARLRTPHRIAILHYSPIQATVEGEPVEIFPFLGSSRLEEPINRYQVTAVVHGHAHHGSPEGTTSTGIPVYNVAMPLLRRSFPNRPGFRVLELPRSVSPSPNGQVQPTAEAITNRVGS